MKSSIIVLLVLCLTCTLGCDPAYTSHTLLDLPPQPRTEAALAGAMKIVADTAEEFGFENPVMTSDPALSGSLQHFSRSYAFEPRHGLYRSVAISTQRQTPNDRFEVAIFEFVASAESEYAKSIRLTIRDRLIERFGASAVHPGK